VIEATVADMVAAATGGLVAPLTFTGVVGLVLIAVVSGRLIPKTSHEREQQAMREAHAGVVKNLGEAHAGVVRSKDEQIARLATEKDEWRQAAGTAEKVAAEVRRQNADLLEVSRTSVYTLQELRKGLAEPRKDVTPRD